jgi:uncharacterized membrane protein YgdD (TMEM256/DUF423 family)
MNTTEAAGIRMANTFQFILIFSAISGFIAVAFGAFGAHALADKLTPERLQTWQTAVQYQFYHTLLLLILSAIGYLFPDKVGQSPLLIYACYAAIAGIFIFSGSLYVLCLSGLRWLGAITPIGGLCFLAAWAILAFWGFKQIS